MPTSKKEKLESLTVMRTALHSEGDEVDVSSKNSSRFEGGIAERLKSTAAPSSSSLLAGKKLIKSTSRSSTDTTASTDSSDASSDDDASSEPMVVPTKKPSSRMEEEKKKEKDAHHPDVVVVVDVPRAVPDRIHAVVDGPLVIIGFGSIGRGVLPLIERHIRLTDRKSLVVIDPCDDFAHILKRHGARYRTDQKNLESKAFVVVAPGDVGGLAPLPYPPPIAAVVVVVVVVVAGGALSNIQLVSPVVGSTMFHHLSPTRRRPVMFLTTQKSAARRSTHSTVAITSSMLFQPNRYRTIARHLNSTWKRHAVGWDELSKRMHDGRGEEGA